MMLARRIAFDTARRMWGLYAVLIVVLFFLGWVANLGLVGGELLATTSQLFGWSMAGAWFAASSPTTLLDAREIARLPVTRREMWVARWLLGVVPPFAVVAVSVGAGTLAALRTADPERSVLVLLYCVLYCGCFTAVSALVPHTAMTKPGARTVIWVLVRLMIVPLGGAILPLWFEQYLPRTFGDLHGPAMSMLIAAAGVTIASYFNRPAIVARPSRPTLQAAAPATTRRTGIGDELTGLRFLFFKEARKMLLIYSTLLALTIVYWMIFESVSLAEFLRVSSALIFAGLPTLHESEFPVIMMFFVVAASDLALMGNMRSYRALPISVNRLSAILTGLNILTALLMWIVLLAAHIIAVGAAPQTLRPDLFLVVAGGLAMSETLQLTLPLEGPFRIMVGGILLAPMLVVFRMTYAASAPWAHAAMIAGGGAALCLSWLLNRRALSRGRRIYKMKSPLASFLPENGR